MYLLLFIFFSLVAQPAGFAYTSFTHEKLVGEAFNYMEQHAENYQDILHLWISAMHKDLDLRDELMTGANAADARTDLFYRRTSSFSKVMGFFLGIDECFEKLQTPFAQDRHFTAMQHFLVLPGGAGKIWSYDGYALEELPARTSLCHLSSSH
jgi:hypothetical protein